MDFNPQHHPLGRFMKPVLIVGVIGVAILIAAALLLSTELALRAWLLGFAFVSTIAIGCLVLLMIHTLSGGVWGLIIRRVVEAGASTLPWLIAFSIPVLLGIHSIYEWSHADVVANDPILQHKAAYLTQGAFSLRMIGYFVIWSVMAYLLVSWGRSFEKDRSALTLTRMRRLSAGGLIVMALTVTLASVDWMMSLEPHWFSTMYGISFIVGCLLSAMAFSIIVSSRTWVEGHYGSIFPAKKFRDLGNLQLAFVMLWAYTAFSQFMLIWYGNLQEEVPYYLSRTHGVWGWIAVALIIFHFFLPFFMLLMRSIKDRPQVLRFVAAWILFMHAVDFYWLIGPAFGESGAAFWVYAAAVVAAFGLWAAIFFWYLGRASLLMEGDPWIRERVEAGKFDREVVGHG